MRKTSYAVKIVTVREYIVHDVNPNAAVSQAIKIDKREPKTGTTHYEVEERSQSCGIR